MMTQVTASASCQFRETTEQSRYSERALQRLSNEELATCIASRHPQASKMEQVLVTRNRSMIRSVALRAGSNGMDFEDIVAYAMEGLLYAARRFDPSRGCKFSTVAVTWMRQRVQRAIQNDGAVRVPSYIHQLFPKLKEAQRTVGNDPVALAEALGITVDAASYAMHGERMRHLAELDAPINLRSTSGDSGVSLSDVVGTGDLAGDVTTKIIIDQWMASLSERDAIIVKMRLEGEELGTISQRLGLHRNTVSDLIRAIAARSEHLLERDECTR